MRGRGGSGAGEPVVLSLAVRAAMVEERRAQTQFEVLVRHLFDRMVNNEVFGEDAPARVMQMAYAIALPGVLVALFLFPAYHGLPPHPLERSFWSQACDHLFYVTYGFTVMGAAMILQWEMMFPDALDMQVMATMPIGFARLLWARVAAMAVFLALVEVGTSGLGTVFLPAVADQRCGFWRQLAAQATAVGMAGACAVAGLVAVQATLVLLPRGRVPETLRATTRSLLLSTLLTVLFLFPLTAHFLPELLGMRGMRLFPPFWFLGVYETVMWGGRAPTGFHAMARVGVMATAGLLLAAGVLYPIAYLRRMRAVIEGAGVRTERRGGGAGIARRAFDRWWLQMPKTRATFYFAGQTLLRTERLHLYLAMYAGVGVALVISGLLAFRTGGSSLGVAVTAEGLRTAAPVVAFWAVAGLRTALLSPLGRLGGWVFRVADGRVADGQVPMAALRGARVLVAGVAMAATMVTVAAVDAAARLMMGPGLVGRRTVGVQVLLGGMLCLILTELFFSTVRTIPFTVAVRKTTRALPLSFVQYFVVFPMLALAMASFAAWMEESTRHFVGGAAWLLAVYGAARVFRGWWEQRPEPQDELLVGLWFSGE